MKKTSKILKLSIDFNLIEVYNIGAKGSDNMERVSIETAIKEAGLKKSFVASKLGIANTYLKEYLQNPCKISVKNAEIICKLTGKSKMCIRDR